MHNERAAVNHDDLKSFIQSVMVFLQRQKHARAHARKTYSFCSWYCDGIHFTLRHHNLLITLCTHTKLLRFAPTFKVTKDTCKINTCSCPLRPYCTSAFAILVVLKLRKHTLQSKCQYVCVLIPGPSRECSAIFYFFSSPLLLIIFSSFLFWTKR